MNRFAPGDPVMAAGQPPVPVGKIESLLAVRGGDRLLIERAFAPGSYVVVPVADVAGAEYDAGCDLRWHRLNVDLPAVLARGVYRRAMGRLTPDPLPLRPPPRLDDAAVLSELQAAAQADPLTAGAELTLRVCHGVAVLDGWIETVGGKVQVDRLARLTPGIWEAKNRLVSDEELRVVVGERIRAAGDVAPFVLDLFLNLGRVLVRIREDAPAGVAGQVERLCRDIPGVRDVQVSQGS